MSMTPHGYTLSVTEAANRGVPALVKNAEQGDNVIVARHGKPVAAVVSIERVDQLRELETELRDIALVLARAATDNGKRVSLDDAIAAFGFDRAELEAELDAEIAAERK
jgi:prevent-host-death family protein